MDRAITDSDSIADNRSDRLPAGAGATTPARNGSNVFGWGVDADPANDPTYPMRSREKDPGLTRVWDRPPLQEPGVEILQSIEHIRTPAVIGTSTPPSGLSGVIRRQAFRWSESNLTHWFLLMGADRINMVEGILQDLARGKIPNIPAEMGIRAEWKYNKRGLAKKVGVALVLGAAVTAFVRSRRDSGPSQPRRLEPPTD